MITELKKWIMLNDQFSLKLEILSDKYNNKNISIYLFNKFLEKNKRTLWIDDVNINNNDNKYFYTNLMRLDNIAELLDLLSSDQWAPKTIGSDGKEIIDAEFKEIKINQIKEFLGVYNEN